MLSTIKRVTIVGAAVAASLGLISASASAAPPTSSGVVSASPATGTSSTSVTILPPQPSFCPGDSTTGGYRVQTYLTSASVDPATLTYNGDGPIAPAGAVAQPLYTAAGQSPASNIFTAAVTGQIIIEDAAYSFGVFPPGFLPAGLYNVGYACTILGVTQKFWNSQLTITTDAAAGGPAQIDYALVTGPPPDVPEVPFGVLLPASAIGLLGGATLVARKRRSKAMA